MLPLTIISCSAVTTSAAFDVMAYGAKGDGSTDDTVPVAKALAAAAAAAPSSVLFPSGKIFLTGPINVSASYMTLQVEGTIKGISGNNTAGGEAFIAGGGWPQIPPLPSYGNSRDGPYLQYQALIYANGLKGIRIIGGGTIDGQGDWWWANQRNRTFVRSGRPNLLQIVNSTDVEVAGVTLRDSPFWCLHTVYCENVHIHHTTVRSRMYAPNSDGFDPDSSTNVMIEHNDVSCGDDYVAVKAGVCGASSPNDCHDPRFTGGAFATKNVTVRFNTFRTGMGVSIGSESSGGISDVLVHDNVMGLCEAGHCENTCCGWGPAMHVKTALTRGGVMENIVFRDNTVYNNTGFIFMETNYQSGDEPPKDYPPTTVRDITFSGNRALGHGVGASWTCSVNDVCNQVTVTNNTIDTSGSPWSCHFIKTYNVSANSPAGLEDCMQHSMNRTSAWRRPRSSEEEKQAAIAEWLESRH